MWRDIPLIEQKALFNSKIIRRKHRWNNNTDHKAHIKKQRQLLENRKIRKSDKITEVKPKLYAKSIYIHKCNDFIFKVIKLKPTT